MAKQSGLGDYLAVDDSSGSARDISDNVISLEIGQPQNLLDVTTLSKSAIERIIGLRDCTVSITGVFDSASNKIHDVFKTPTGSRTVTYCIGGNSGGNPKLEFEANVNEYNISRGTDGSLGVTAGLSLNSGTAPAWSTV